MPTRVGAGHQCASTRPRRLCGGDAGRHRRVSPPPPYARGWAIRRRAEQRGPTIDGSSPSRPITITRPMGLASEGKVGPEPSRGSRAGRILICTIVPLVSRRSDVPIDQARVRSPPGDLTWPTGPLPIFRVLARGFGRGLTAEAWVYGPSPRPTAVSSGRTASPPPPARPGPRSSEALFPARDRRRPPLEKLMSFPLLGMALGIHARIQKCQPTVLERTASPGLLSRISPARAERPISTEEKSPIRAWVDARTGPSPPVSGPPTWAGRKCRGSIPAIHHHVKPRKIPEAGSMAGHDPSSIGLAFALRLYFPNASIAAL